jgi:hypothetical protein
MINKTFVNYTIEIITLLCMIGTLYYVYNIEKDYKVMKRKMIELECACKNNGEEEEGDDEDEEDYGIYARDHDDADDEEHEEKERINNEILEKYLENVETAGLYDISEDEREGEQGAVEPKLSEVGLDDAYNIEIFKPKCQVILKQGKNKGEVCGRVVLPDLDVCYLHKK